MLHRLSNLLHGLTSKMAPALVSQGSVRLGIHAHLDVLWHIFTTEVVEQYVSGVFEMKKVA